MGLVIMMLTFCFLAQGEAGVVVEKIDDRTARVTTTTEAVTVQEKTIAEIDDEIARYNIWIAEVQSSSTRDITNLETARDILIGAKADAIKAEVMTQQEWEAAQPEPEVILGEGE